MVIRPYRPNDYIIIADMLSAEGIASKDMDYADKTTFVCEKDSQVVGFYSCKLEREIFPHLQHFCVSKDARDGTLDIARYLIRDFRGRMKELGYCQAFINAPKLKRKVSRMIQWYFKTEVISTDDEHRFYLVMV